jgi:hypothetical protein
VGPEVISPSLCGMFEVSPGLPVHIVRDHLALWSHGSGDSVGMRLAGHRFTAVKQQ